MMIPSGKQPAVDLTVKDHTLIVKTILDNMLTPSGVIAQLKSTIPKGKEPSQIDALNAALMVPTIDEYVKSRIRIILDELPKLEEAREKIPKATKDAAAEIQEQIDNCGSVDEMIKVLKGMKESGEYNKYEGLSTEIDVGIGILEDGRDTIYSPDYWRRIPNQVRGASLICSKCGGDNPPTNKFCRKCGNKLMKEQPTDIDG